MRQLLIPWLFVVNANLCNAQTSEEWLQQKETQRKYLIAQIIAFQTYLGYVQKGNEIAHKGLTTISNIKNGEFNLHRDFFGSLKSINPELKDYVKVGDIVALQLRIVQLYKSTNKQVQSSRLFEKDEKKHISKVFSNLLNECSSLLGELTLVITEGELEMKDDERIRWIDALYNSMQDNYAFAQSFGNEAKLLALQRVKEKNDVLTSRTLNGIKNK